MFNLKVFILILRFNRIKSVSDKSKTNYRNSCCWLRVTFLANLSRLIKNGFYFSPFSEVLFKLWGGDFSKVELMDHVVSCPLLPEIILMHNIVLLLIREVRRKLRDYYSGNDCIHTRGVSGMCCEAEVAGQVLLVWLSQE